MKINFVYEFSSCYGKIVNGINPEYLRFLFNDDFCFQRTNIDNFQSNINHIISFWKPAYLYNYDNSDEYTIASIKNFKESELYLYPISTGGDLFEFLSLRTTIHNTPLFYISEKTKKLLKNNNNFFIYLEHPGEPYFSSDLLKKIYELCLNNDIPFNKIIIINGTNSNEFILEDFKEKYGIKENPKLISYNWAVPFKSLELRSKLGLEKNPQAENSTISNINHITLNKEKKALFLVKRLRVHRLSLMSMLFESNLIEDILYSLDVSMNLYPNFIEILNNEPDTLPISIPEKKFKELISGYKKLLKKEKAVLDYHDFNSVHGFGMETKELYEKTYFSIVAETEFSQYQKSITEKIIKPIMHCHPFIVLGSPDSLKTLKTFGFKTFDKWWDESYDNELDDWTRIEKVYNLINKLINLTDSDWKKMILEMKDVLEYNQKLLTTFTSSWILKQIKNNFLELNKKDVITIL